MLYAILGIYVTGLAVWGYCRIRKLDRNLRANKRKTQPEDESDAGLPSWYKDGAGTENWPKQKRSSWPEK